MGFICDSEHKFQYHWSHSVSSFPGANKETPIVTPLMEYVRQKRAVDTGMQVIFWVHELPQYLQFMICTFCLNYACKHNYSLQLTLLLGWVKEIILLLYLFNLLYHK